MPTINLYFVYRRIVNHGWRWYKPWMRKYVYRISLIKDNNDEQIIGHAATKELAELMIKTMVEVEQERLEKLKRLNSEKVSLKGKCKKNVK